MLKEGLLGDGVRVLVRSMKKITHIAGQVGSKLVDRSRSVKLRVLGISHRQNKHPVAFAAPAFRTNFGVTDRPLQQRTAQQLASHRHLAQKLVALSLGGSVANH